MWQQRKERELNQQLNTVQDATCILPFGCVIFVNGVGWNAFVYAPGVFCCCVHRLGSISTWYYNKRFNDFSLINDINLLKRL